MMKLGTIAEKLDCELRGDAGVEIDGVAGVDEATASQLTFLSNPRYQAGARQTKAAAIFVGKQDDELPCAQLISKNPYLDFARALELFYQAPRPAAGIHPTAVIDPTSTVGEGASVGPYVTVGPNCSIGKNAVLHPHTAIYQGVRIGDDFTAHSHAAVREFCQIGDRVILQNGVLVGTDGYGFARRDDGTHHKIPQAGVVVIEDDVEIQAGTCVDRAAVGETRIRKGAKIDNLVQIGHAVEIGENNIICSQVGIAGSTTLGANCILAGQVGIINHLSIGNNVLITAKTGVGTDVPDGSKISGSPSIDNRQWLRCTAVYNRLPELDRELKRLKKRVEAKSTRQLAD